MLFKYSLGECFTSRPITLLRHIGGKDFLQRILSHTCKAETLQMDAQFFPTFFID
jgi:hypothetical protein